MVFGSMARPAWSACRLEAFEIPVRMVHMRPIATVELNGIETPMLVDSGAFFSLLTEATASQLNLPLQRLSPGFRIEGLTGQVNAKVTRVDKVRFNGVEIAGVEFIVGVNELGSGIMGVLGRNFLSLADTEYDLARGIVRLVVPKGQCEETNFAYWAGKAPVNVVPLIANARGDTAIRVVARINGVRVKALMDTGAMTGLNLDTAHRAGVKDADMAPLGRIGGAGDGHAQSWVASFASFELGGEQISNNRFDVYDADGADDSGMLLGIDYFLSHRIYVSRLQNKVYATWNGGVVFARDKIDETQGVARDAAAPEAVAPDDADGLARRGEAAAARGDLSRALQDLDRACALAPQVARYFLARARVRAAMNQSAKAQEDLDEALRLDASLHDARQLRASWRAGAGDREGAISDLRALDAALHPSSHLRAGVARVYARLNLAPEALHQWDLWMSSHRNDAELGSVLNARCWLQIRLKLDPKLAIDDCKRAVKEDDEEPDFHDSLGWAYLRLDDPSAAVESFERAIKLREASPWSYYGRAQAYRRLGKAQAAERDLMSARKLDPQIDDKVRSDGFDAETPPIAAPKPASAGTA
ncbi:MAG TPA: aspartyl protease family protein [Albitalea sp.]|nr:aspartyl protease family protein [Albitalea sp.]